MGRALWRVQTPTLSRAIANVRSGLLWLSLAKLWKPPMMETCWPFPALELMKKLFLMSDRNLPNCSAWTRLFAVSSGLTKVCLVPSSL